MLWQNKDGVWTVTRVISYNHNHGLLAKKARMRARCNALAGRSFIMH
jgi:hypothetical protein